MKQLTNVAIVQVIKAEVQMNIRCSCDPIVIHELS